MIAAICILVYILVDAVAYRYTITRIHLRLDALEARDRRDRIEQCGEVGTVANYGRRIEVALGDVL